MPFSPFMRGLGALTITAPEKTPRKATKAFNLSTRPPSAGSLRQGLAADGSPAPIRSNGHLGKAKSPVWRQQPPGPAVPELREGWKGEGRARAHTSRGLTGPGRRVGSARGWALSPRCPLLPQRSRRAMSGDSGGVCRQQGEKPRICSRCALPRPHRNTQHRGKYGERRREELVQTWRGTEVYWRSGLRKRCEDADAFYI